MTGTRMVRVASTRDGFEARVIAARLGAEGIVWELQGSVDGPYPLGVVHVLVEAGGVDAARELLLLEPEEPEEVGVPHRRDAVSWRGGIVTAVALALVALLGLARVMALL